jgi:hypothetical protein
MNPMKSVKQLISPLHAPWGETWFYPFSWDSWDAAGDEKQWKSTHRTA